MIIINMNGKSPSITEEKLKELQGLFPEAFTEGKINFDILKSALGEEVELGERYGLSWKGKSDVFRIIQEQTTKALKPQREESVNFDTSENLFIEGDNLEVLKVLQRAYYGKVKMIYIDPPYNTGNDFVYNDKFSQLRKDYEQEAGIRDEEGNIKRQDSLYKNSKDGGHYHSNWLNMMYPRLYLARNLLKEDGVIFVSIDDNEVHNLRMIMNEIFGEENFISIISWRRRSNQPNDKSKMIAKVSEYILVYAKENFALSYGDSFFGISLNSDRAADFTNPDNDPRGPWTSNPWKAARGRGGVTYSITTPSGIEYKETWYGTKELFEKMAQENRVHWTNSGEGLPRIKIYYEEKKDLGQLVHNFWHHDDFGSNQDASADLGKLMGNSKIFDNPKPTQLIKSIIQIATSKKDIILDFFAGSATTAHAVMQLNADDGGNRKWIMVQLPEVTDEDSEAKKAGYSTVADIAKERIRRAAKKISEENNDKNFDLGFKVFRLEDTNFKIWNSHVKDEEQLQKQLEGMFDVVREGVSEEDILFELIIKNGIEPNVRREKKEENGQGYWKIGSGELIICLAKEINQEFFSYILSEKPQKIILLDQSFSNDELKTNLLLQAEKKEIEVNVI